MISLQNSIVLPLSTPSRTRVTFKAAAYGAHDDAYRLYAPQMRVLEDTVDQSSRFVSGQMVLRGSPDSIRSTLMELPTFGAAFEAGTVTVEADQPLPEV